MRAALALVVLLAPLSAAAQDATAAELDAIHAWVDFRAVRARFGDAHESTALRRDAAQAAIGALEAAILAGHDVDVAAVAAALEPELTDVLARLGELGTRCGGPAVEVLSAEARRDALREALAGLAGGRPFVPVLS